MGDGEAGEVSKITWQVATGAAQTSSLENDTRALRGFSWRLCGEGDFGNCCFGSLSGFWH